MTPSIGLQKKATKTPLIIDTDTANEIDDLFAVIRAVNESSIDLKGVTSAQFHTSPLASDNSVMESQEINEELFRLMEHDIPLPLGANKPIQSIRKPSPSDASEFIIKEARNHSPQNPLHLAILGSCTNVASAVLLAPDIKPNIKVIYLGFWHDPETNTYDKKEFNTGNDVLANQVLLNDLAIDLTVMSATTSQHLVFTKKELDQKLKDKGPLAELLINRWESYNRWWTDEDTEKTEWIMWDVALIEAIANPQYATKKVFKTPKDNTQRDISIYTEIKKEEMIQEFWNHFKSNFEK